MQIFTHKGDRLSTTSARRYMCADSFDPTCRLDFSVETRRSGRLIEGLELLLSPLCNAGKNSEEDDHVASVVTPLRFSVSLMCFFSLKVR